MNAVTEMTEAPPFLTARWLHLLMLNYEVAPALLRAHVPAGTELDCFEGRCLVSMVGFQFLETRVRGLAVPFHRDFEEVNLRLYVRREAGGELRRGVVFVKEIVPRRAIAWVANALYNEKYVALPMEHEDGIDGDGGHVQYRWKHRGHWARLGALVEGKAQLPAPGSEAEFISEHYFGYTAQRDGSTLEYRVEHPQWAVWKAREPVFECDVASLYGADLVEPLATAPSSCFVAEGSEVVVRRGAPLL
ncbi:MAG: DUF2071 domain-containing protein [Myxococcales bacterium]|nr:DUF2071 domain-containing protein [Myxococcales bacterium]